MTWKIIRYGPHLSPNSNKLGKHLTGCVMILIVIIINFLDVMMMLCFYFLKFSYFRKTHQNILRGKGMTSRICFEVTGPGEGGTVRREEGPSGPV